MKTTLGTDRAREGYGFPARAGWLKASLFLCVFERLQNEYFVAFVFSGVWQ